MSQYSNPTAEDISFIIEQFVSSDEISYKLLSGGSQNTNYHIHTSDKDYVLTICEEKSVEETAQLVYLLEHLANHNFASSVVLRSITGQPTKLWNHKPVMLKAYLDGKIMNPISKPLLESCGKQLAQLHGIPTPDYLPCDLSYGLNQFHEIEQYAPDSDFHHWLRQITELVNSQITPDLPKALIHSDIFDSNVIISPDETSATIMDFEEACHYYRVFDIGMMIVGLCNHNRTVDMEEAACILKGYQSESQLSNKEKESLQAFTVYAAAATAFWRHKQFNYINPDDDQKDRYLEMRDVAEYVRGMRKKEFSKLFYANSTLVI